MKITKILFPMVTVIRLEGEGMEPKYFSNFPGESTYPSEDVITTEEEWKEALREAKEKGVKVIVNEV